jgi:hypothetical protein
MAPGTSLALQSDGTNWLVYAGNPVLAGSTGAIQTNGTNGVFGSIAPGTGVATALANATNSNGGMTTQNGSITSGDCLKESSGIADAGYACPSSLHPGFVTGGVWYNLAAAYNGNVAGAGQIASTIYCNAHYVPATVAIDQIGVNFSAGSTSFNVSAAIYNIANGRPNSLLNYTTVTTAQVASGGIGLPLNTSNYTLNPGWYYFCESQNNTGTMVGINPGGATGQSFAIGSATLNNVTQTTSQVTGLSCAISSTTCGSGGSGCAAWGGSPPGSATFTWCSSLSGVTWTTLTTAIMPVIAIKTH